MKRIRFGIIGGGLMGREFASAAARWCHLNDVPAIPEIVAVSDVNPGATEWFTRHFPTVDAYSNYQGLLADKRIEAVYVAVPHHLHEEIYVATLNAGKHLFAEKPFGIDLAAAKRIYETARLHPELLVRVSSEFPFYPAAVRIAQMLDRGEFGEVFEVRAGFLHSSDLDPTKPINWKRRIVTNGEYGCMGDLGLHVLHLPLRFGFHAANVRALLTRVVNQRPAGPNGPLVPTETWDNAILACTSTGGVPMVFETKRVSPGDTNTWYIRILGTKCSAEFSTRHPKTLRTMPYEPGESQTWREEDLGYSSVTPAVTGHIFEFGFTDAILQMWASFVTELAGETPRFRCASPEEALDSHRLFTAALESHRESATMEVRYR